MIFNINSTRGQTRFLMCVARVTCLVYIMYACMYMGFVPEINLFVFVMPPLQERFSESYLGQFRSRYRHHVYYTHCQHMPDVNAGQVFSWRKRDSKIEPRPMLVFNSHPIGCGSNTLTALKRCCNIHHIIWHCRIPDDIVTPIKWISHCYLSYLVFISQTSTYNA